MRAAEVEPPVEVSAWLRRFAPEPEQSLSVPGAASLSPALAIPERVSVPVPLEVAELVAVVPEALDSLPYPDRRPDPCPNNPIAGVQPRTESMQSFEYLYSYRFYSSNTLFGDPGRTQAPFHFDVTT